MTSLSLDAIDEADLVDRLKHGDEAAYEILVRLYGGRMAAVARRFLKFEHDCHDAVQDAFLSAFRALHAFAGNASLSTWLHRITVNVCLMKLRSQSRRGGVSIDDGGAGSDDAGPAAPAIASRSEAPHEIVARRETRAEILACIERLPRPFREVVLLRDIEEYDTAATAQMLGVSTDAVKTRLHRARQCLRPLLEERLQPTV